ncbi:limonoid UDP-glucosyltransferase-like [Ipomoea triloba]|uniref:limonoid UDP-glucosyltransferase-like n=1 Tax=Ipomoea triloba TaxID=35885 RepID=UPI00125DB1AC|nr:limonoid UDP-glucosyltransferase-like [Ipomoea triloba]
MDDSCSNESLIHVFLVSFPGQGHVNPLLRLGKRLASKGMFVTFCAPECIGRDMRRVNDNISDRPTPYGAGSIRFEFFDGWEYGQTGAENRLELELQTLELVGRRELPSILQKQARPVSCLINNSFIPWVCDVAESLGIPNAVLWVQSCASFSAYYHFNFDLVPFPTDGSPEMEVEIPGMPVLKHDEVPGFLHPRGARFHALRTTILNQFKKMSVPFCFLVDSFEELEADIIGHMSGICTVKTVGPLLFKDPEVEESNEVRADLVSSDKNSIIEWLDSKPVSSVVYISSGSIALPSQEQVNEIAQALIKARVCFLWIMKSQAKYYEPVVLPMGFLEKVGDHGKVVEWCPQERVLAHPSIACFVTHCGWNSTIEAIAYGVPVLTFPYFGDQVLNAKFLVDEFKMGLRLSRGVFENRTISCDEIEQCLTQVMSSPNMGEIKENALKWKKKAEEAVADGGSSDRNIEQFVNEIMRRSRNEKYVK